MTDSNTGSPSRPASGADHATTDGSGPARVLLVSWGELLWDLFSDGPRLGGAAANLAYHAARLGATSVLVSRVGDDELGHRAIADLARAGIDVGFIQIDPAAPTGTVHVDVSDGEPRFRIGQRAAWDHIDYGPALAELVTSADVFCFSTLAQRGALASEALRRALSDVPGRCLRFCDLNLRAPFYDDRTVLDSIGRADVVKLNEAEAAELSRLGAGDDVASWLFGRGVKLVALTRGRHGAELLRGDGQWAHPGLPADPSGDSVGAGDSFSAALLFHLARGAAPPEALERATRLAAYVASRRGAMPALPPDVLHDAGAMLRRPA